MAQPLYIHLYIYIYPFCTCMSPFRVVLRNFSRPTWYNMLWITDCWKQDVNRTSTTCLWKSEATAQVEPLRAVVATDSIYLLSKSDRVAKPVQHQAFSFWNLERILTIYTLVSINILSSLTMIYEPRARELYNDCCWMLLG